MTNFLIFDGIRWGEPRRDGDVVRLWVAHHKGGPQLSDPTQQINGPIYFNLEFDARRLPDEIGKVMRFTGQIADVRPFERNGSAQLAVIVKGAQLHASRRGSWGGSFILEITKNKPEISFADNRVQFDVVGNNEPDFHIVLAGEAERRYWQVSDNRKLDAVGGELRVAETKNGLGLEILAGAATWSPLNRSARRGFERCLGSGF